MLRHSLPLGRRLGPAKSPVVASSDQRMSWRLMKPRNTLTAGPYIGDEVARQRRKRADALLDRPVAGFEDLTLRDVLISVLAATEESPEPLDVERFLSERGHAWQTVEMVVASLKVIDRHPSSPKSGPEP